MIETHFVPYDSPGNRIAQALCGKFVRRNGEHSPQPSCKVCEEEQRKYEALDLGQHDPPPAPPPAKPKPARVAASTSRAAPVPVWHGHISDDGRFGLLEAEKADRQAYFRTLAGLDVDITVARHTDTRSDRANRYYWSGVLTPMSRDGSDGDQSPEEIHDAMCQMFLPDERKRVEFYNRMTGETLAVETDSRRSSKLKGDEFYTFVEKVRKFALEFMGVTTEDPDPAYWKKRQRAAA